MKLNFKSRTWHKWGGLLIALPILVVAITALFISHRKTLGTEEIKVAAHWLPGYQDSSVKSWRNEARCSLHTAAGETYLGTLGGLYRLSGKRLVTVEELGDTQIRGLAEASWGRIAATKSGIWLEQNGNWQHVVKGDAWSASSRSDGSITVALRNKGLLVSIDGQRWQEDAQLNAALANLPGESAEAITLSRLVFDLHSGRALLGKDNEWIWIDLTGLTLCLLALTGVYTWLRNKRRKVMQRTRPAVAANRPFPE